MGLNLLDWFTEDDDEVVVKSLTSKHLVQLMSIKVCGYVLQGAVKVP